MDSLPERVTLALGPLLSGGRGIAGSSPLLSGSGLEPLPRASARHARACRTAVRFKGGPLPHAPAVMPVRVTGIHEIDGPLGIPKTWIAGIRPLLSGLGRRPLSHVPTVVPALVAGIHGIGGTLETLKTWMAGTTPGDDAKNGGSANRVPLVSATRMHRKSAAISHRRQRLTGQPCACRGHPRVRRNA